MTKLNLLKGSVSGISLALACLMPTSVFAQEEEGARESATPIIVTGSRIRGIEPTGSPVIGLDRSDMELSAAATTTELLSELPQVFNLGANDASFTAANNQNANRTFGTGVNLRGLGTESTLNLLDGRRVPSAGTQSQYFDPSVIPTSAIARLEVLADGSSGIYGSDAVGGVVNIILRKDFDGADISGRVKFADGMTEYQIGGAIGKSWGTGSVMVAAEYTDREGLLASDRPYYTDDLRAFGGADLRSDFAAPGNIIVNNVSYAIPNNQNGVGLTPGQFTANTRNLRSNYEGTEILPPQQRTGLAMTFEQDLTPWLSVYAQGVYAERKAEFIRGALTTSAVVPVTNPFYVNPGTAGRPVTVRYSFANELGNTVASSSQKFYHATGGLKMDLGSGWSGDAFFSYGKNVERSGNPNINAAALNAALANTNPATALNLFSSTGNNNPATVAGLLGTFRVDTDNTLKEYGLSFDGPVFSLPGGEVRLALGAARQEIRWVDITPFPSNRTRDVNSLFGEIFVPLIGGDGPELNLSAAVRHDDYEVIGGTTNPKIGLTFKPNDSISLRASFGKSFRAPTLSDTGNPFNQASSFANETNTGTYRVLFLRGGNPTLQPETATTWSAGMDFNPVAIPELQLSMTYYRVAYQNRIATPGNDNLAFQKPELAFLINDNPTLAQINAIISGPGWASPPEDPNGIVAIVDGRKVNVGRIKTDGLEFIGNYAAQTSWGGWRAGFNAAWIMNFDRSLIPGTPLVEIVDTINNPRGLMARAYTGVDIGDFGATIFANYQGDYMATGAQSVPSHTEFDLALRYNLESPFSFTQALTFSLDVQDLFDKDPPTVLNGLLPFDSNSHSMVGRTISIGVRAKI